VAFFLVFLRAGLFFLVAFFFVARFRVARFLAMRVTSCLEMSEQKRK
jgi:hypothetical protein